MNDAQTPSGGRFHFVTRGRGRPMSTGSAVNFSRSPYGLQIIENCVTCPHKESRLFCNLPSEAIQHLSEITASATYPKGATLFVEGQPARGVFILCAGHVKLSTSSSDGRTLILRISEPGDLLGLPATISGRSYEVTAEVMEPTQANFIAHTDFLNFLREHGEAALRVAQTPDGVFIVYVEQAKHEAGVHAVLNCGACHGDIKEFPHPKRIARVECATCHADQAADVWERLAALTVE